MRQALLTNILDDRLVGVRRRYATISGAFARTVIVIVGTSMVTPFFGIEWSPIEKRLLAGNNSMTKRPVAFRCGAAWIAQGQLQGDGEHNSEGAKLKGAAKKRNTKRAKI